MWRNEEQARRKAPAANISCRPCAGTQEQHSARHGACSADVTEITAVLESLALLGDPRGAKGCVLGDRSRLLRADRGSVSVPAGRRWERSRGCRDGQVLPGPPGQREGCSRRSERGQLLGCTAKHRGQRSLLSVPRTPAWCAQRAPAPHSSALPSEPALGLVLALT